MSQLPLFLALHALGVAVGLATGLRERPLLASALGFLIGLAVAVFLELFALGVGLPFTNMVGVLLVAATLAGCGWRIRGQGGLDRHAWRVLVRWTLGFAAAGFLLTRANFSILTYDSHYIVAVGRIIAEDSAIAPRLMERLGDYGVFAVLAHALVKFGGQSFLWALAPVFSASTMALFGVVLATALDALGVRFRGRGLAVALVTAATFSAYMILRHSFYIHTNLGTAAYLFVFCSLFWLSEQEQSTSALPVAFIALTAVALHRIEGPLVCILFLSLSLLGSRLPARRLLLALAAYTLAVVGWYLRLARGVPANSAFLTPSRCYLLAGVTVAFLGYAALSSRARFATIARLHRFVPALVAAAFALALAAAFALNYDHMYQSASGWFSCLWGAPYWTGIWQVIIGLALLGLVVAAPPGRWMFVCGVPAYLALILLLSWARSPYYWGIGDSATRMSIHVLPLVFFYFALKFLPLLTPPRPRT